MAEVYFYQLSRQPLEEALGQLLARALQNGWRVAVRGTDPAQLASLDSALWTAEAGSFLPHGLAGGPQDADQPILLTLSAKAANRPHCVMLIDSAALDASDFTQPERTCVIFDGNDPASLENARAQWRQATDSGTRALYWAEEHGKWLKKAER